MNTSASIHAWRAAGTPPHPYAEERVEALCATCGALTPTCVPLAQIETPTTSAHADLFRFGTRHVCPACAWLFAAGKGRPGNYMAAGGKFEHLVVSAASIVADKRPWRQALRDVATMPLDALVTGVMTTDVKPRLWPRTRLASIGRFGLYIHCPDYDVSEWRLFDLGACVALIEQVETILSQGFSKTVIYHGLLGDYARTIKRPAQALAWEEMLAAQRKLPHFLPALIAAGIVKQETHHDSVKKTTGVNDAATTGRDQPDQAQPGLF